MKKWLLAIFFLALLLRTVNLGDLPHGFFEEEVTNAYVGRFILENGKDLYGNILPLLYFDKFHDYPPVLPMYISGLGTFVFGNTEFAARFPIALIGALTVFPVFGLAQMLLGGGAYFGAFLLATLPWHVVLSRTGAEGIIGLYVFTLALLWILQKKIRWAMIAFFLTYFLYPSFRLLVPLTVLPLSFLQKPRKTLLIAGVGFFLLTAVISMTVWGRGRFEQTSVFKSQEIWDRVNFLNTYFSNDEGTDRVKLARLFHNKPIGFAREIAKQYMSYFSPTHLFYEAEGQPRYFNVPQQGLLYLTMGLLLLGALIPIGSKKYMGFIVYLLVIAPIPAVLTIDFVPHAHRAIIMILPLVLIAAYGYKALVRFRVVLVILLIAELIFFWHQYSHHSASYQSILRNDGDKEVTRYVIAHEDEYERIVMPMFARLPVYYAYFTGNYSTLLAGQFRNELKIDRIGKVEFFTDWCPTKYLKPEELQPRTLVVDNGDCPGVDGYDEIDSFVRRDGTRAYKILVWK